MLSRFLLPSSASRNHIVKTNRYASQNHCLALLAYPLAIARTHARSVAALPRLSAVIRVHPFDRGTTEDSSHVADRLL